MPSPPLPSARRRARTVVGALLTVAAWALGLGLSALAARAAPPAHPRLFLAQRAELVRHLATASPHHAAAWHQLLARVQQGLAAYDGKPGYRASALAREAALAYQVTGDVRYARLARETLLASRKDEDQPDAGYGLSRAMMCLGYALAYDWCWSAWSPEERAEILAIMRSAADHWPNFQHPNVEAPHKGSNWVGVTRGGELLLHLAARGDGDYGLRDDRIALCLGDLERHLATAYGPSGWTQEGLGYLEYTLGFLLPALEAAKEAGLGAPGRRFDSIPWHRLMMMACSFRSGHEFLASGVSGPASSDEGMASLCWLVTPPEDRPAYRYFYDRHVGVAALRPTFDSRRAGTVWALLFYPPDVPERVPAAEPLFDSQKGAYYFRNRWQDQDDVLVSLMTRADQHGNAWQQPETWQIALIAYDTTFAGGPGKERDPLLYSKLLINGRTEILPKTSGVREISARAPIAGGGVIESDASRNFGLDVARRRFAVDFTGRSGCAAVVQIDDRLENATPFTATFQLCPEKDVRIEALPGAQGVPPGFILRGHHGWVRGWVRSPADATIDAHGPLRVTTREGTAHALALTLAIGTGEPPAHVPQSTEK